MDLIYSALIIFLLRLADQSLGTMRALLVAKNKSLYAALIGYFIWGDVPDEWKICGAALIVGAGIFILYREGQQKAVR